VKNNHCFLHKGLHGAQFSSEPGNLYNVNSYTYSGLVNEKTVHVEASTEGGISITRTLPKHANKPKNFKSKTNKKGKNFRRTAVRLGKEVHGIRPDLKAGALARASAINKSQRTAAAKKS